MSDRFKYITHIEDRLRSLNVPGTFGRCITWNYVDDWVPFLQGTGLKPYTREFWVDLNISFEEARAALLAKARQVRDKLLTGIGGIEGIDLETGLDTGRGDFWREQVAEARKRSVILVP